MTALVDGHVSQQVECSCGWRSAKVWVERHTSVVDSWADQHAEVCSGLGSAAARVADREREAECLRLQATLDVLDAKRSQLVTAIELLRGVA